MSSTRHNSPNPVGTAVTVLFGLSLVLATVNLISSVLSHGLNSKITQESALAVVVVVIACSIWFVVMTDEASSIWSVVMSDE